MCIQNLKFLALPVSEVIGGTWKRLETVLSVLMCRHLCAVTAVVWSSCINSVNFVLVYIDLFCVYFYGLLNSNCSTPDHEVYLVVPSATRQSTITYEAPNYPSAVTCSGPMTHVTNNSCVTPAVSDATAADGGNADDEVDDVDDDAESSATSTTVRLTSSATSCVRLGLKKWVMKIFICHYYRENARYHGLLKIVTGSS